MKVLIVNSGKSKFVIGENNVEPENLSRADLLMILNNIYPELFIDFQKTS